MPGKLSYFIPIDSDDFVPVVSGVFVPEAEDVFEFVDDDGGGEAAWTQPHVVRDLLRWEPDGARATERQMQDNECQDIWTDSAIFKTHKLRDTNNLAQLNLI